MRKRRVETCCRSGISQYYSFRYLNQKTEFLHSMHSIRVYKIHHNNVWNGEYINTVVNRKKKVI